jgi:hypothetical protein
MSISFSQSPGEIVPVLKYIIKLVRKTALTLPLARKYSNSYYGFAGLPNPARTARIWQSEPAKARLFISN